MGYTYVHKLENLILLRCQNYKYIYIYIYMERERFNAISTKILMSVLAEIEKSIIIYMEF
jgi:hypothetical protein